MEAAAKVIHLTDKAPLPQLEDGYTRIANELLDALVHARFSARQYSVLLTIIRKTYGYNKKSDDIGLSQIAALTGLSKANASRTVNELAKLRAIIKTEGQFGHRLSVNKHYGQWGLPSRQLPPTVAKLATPPVANLATTKDNLPKDNLPKDKTLLRTKPCATCYGDDFLSFWSLYPNKKNKAGASKSFSKLSPSADLLATILAAVEAQKASPDWIREGGQFIPYAQTWLNGARWEDEVAPVIGEFSDQQKSFVDVFNANIGGQALPVREWSQKAADLVSLALASKWSLEKWGEFWRFVRDECEFKGAVSFEWLMKRDNIVLIKRGEFQAGGEKC